LGLEVEFGVQGLYSNRSFGAKKLVSGQRCGVEFRVRVCRAELNPAKVRAPGFRLSVGSGSGCRFSIVQGSRFGLRA